MQLHGARSTPIPRQPHLPTSQQQLPLTLPRSPLLHATLHGSRLHSLPPGNQAPREHAQVVVPHCLPPLLLFLQLGSCDVLPASYGACLQLQAAEAWHLALDVSVPAGGAQTQTEH